MAKYRARKEVAEIPVIGDVDDWEADVVKALLELPPRSECVFYIDSMGGSVYGALAVMTLLRHRQLEATAIVLGSAPRRRCCFSPLAAVAWSPPTASCCFTACAGKATSVSARKRRSYGPGTSIRWKRTWTTCKFASSASPRSKSANGLRVATMSRAPRSSRPAWRKCSSCDHPLRTDLHILD